MAHPITPEQIDAAAAAAADAAVASLTPAADAPPADPILAYGAAGEPVTKLVNLLALLGYNTNDIVKGAPPVLDESVLVDARAAQAALGVTEAPEAAGVSGELVGQATWTALYAAAEAKLDAEQAAASDGGSAASAA